MSCPQCGLMLKEKGDGGKLSQGEYLVVEHKDGRKVKCLECNHEDYISYPSSWWKANY